MRKFVSVVLSVCILFNMVVFCVYAEESNTMTPEVRSREEVIELACEIWPQYAEKLTADQRPLLETRNATSNNTVVVSETVILSDNEKLQYVEYSSGLALAALGGWYEDTVQNGSNHKYVTGSLTVASGSSVSYLVGVAYTIDYGGIDYFNLRGVFDNTNATISSYSYSMKESSSSPAYITYQVNFVDALGNYYGSAIANLRLTGDKFTWSVA